MEKYKTFEEFRKQFPTKKGKQHKIRNCFGSYGIYKLMRKRGWYNIGRPVTEHEYYTMITQEIMFGVRMDDLILSEY